MDWLAEYVKAWSRHSINFGVSCTWSGVSRFVLRYHTVLVPFNILVPNPELPFGAVLTIDMNDECLVYRFPHAHQRRELGGELNKRFLNPESLNRALEGVSKQTIILLSIPQIYETEDMAFDIFLERLDSFFNGLVPSRCYAMEIYNTNYLLPDYFDLLRKHGIAHVVQNSAVFTADFGIMRDVQPDLDAVYAIRQALDEQKTLFAYLRQERDFFHLMELLDNDLKSLSPIRKTQVA